MNVLLCGADGFLGRAITIALERASHRVVRGVHHPRRSGDIIIDYQTDLAPEVWLPRLAGIDVVINAVGILRERQAGDFERIHHLAPVALFAACAACEVKRVIQISALGGQFHGVPPAYLASKHAADHALWTAVPERGVVLRPGLIYGRDGASTQLFLTLASLPIHVVPSGVRPVQPVHVDDVVVGVIKLVDGAIVANNLLELPGARPLSYGDWLATYRTGMRLPRAWRLPIPGVVMSAVARVAGLLPGSLLSADTWTMLKAGNTADPVPASRLLGRPLKAPTELIAPEDAELLRLRALAAWQRPLARGVVAAIWLVTAAISAWVFPVAESLALLAPYGLAGDGARAALAIAVLLDLVMGIATLLRPGRRLWLAQLALIAGYTALIAWKLPAFLIHPFGPVLKNLAVVGLLVMLYAEEDKS
jgi:uncharacterized protein YbjT (DUF2867 family)